MEEHDVVKELTKILTLEHGHLGMYKNFSDHKDKTIRKTFSRFAELEIEHINRLRNILLNLGTKPSLLIESGDIIGQLFGITINVTNTHDLLKTYSFIEKKSHQGYSEFITKLETADEKRSQFIGEFISSNMLEAKLMELWLENELKNYSLDEIE